MGGVGLAVGEWIPWCVCVGGGVGARDEGTSLLLSPKPGPRQLEGQTTDGESASLSRSPLCSLEAQADWKNQNCFEGGQQGQVSPFHPAQVGGELEERTS